MARFPPPIWIRAKPQCKRKWVTFSLGFVYQNHPSFSECILTEYWPWLGNCLSIGKRKKRHPLSQFPMTGQEKTHLLIPIVGQEKLHLLALHFGWLCEWQPKALSVSWGVGRYFYPGLTLPLRAGLSSSLFPTPPFPTCRTLGVSTISKTPLVVEGCTNFILAQQQFTYRLSAVEGGCCKGQSQGLVPCLFQ